MSQKNGDSFMSMIILLNVVCRFLPYVGWVTIIMTEKPIVKVWSLLLSPSLED